MSDREARIATLQRANVERHLAKRGSVERAMADMQRRGVRITLNAVAKTAGVSRNFIYQTPELKKAVDAAAKANEGRMPQGRTTATEASLRKRLTVALDALADSKERVQQLERRVEGLTAEVVRLQAQ